MKNTLLLAVVLFMLPATSAFAQRQCGIQQVKAAMIARNPEWADKFETQRASLQGIADNYKLQQKTAGAERTTATVSPIPVIFHVIVTSAQLTTMGGTAGVLARCDSQIAVLNRDYNRQNSDSVLIPSGWKHLYASTGIRFGLAHTSPAGAGTPGYELLIIPSSPGGFDQGIYGDYSDAKNSSSGGLDAWDNTKYMNVWCINFADNSGLLGITTSKSFTIGAGAEPSSSEGIAINYLALGKRASSSDHYIATGYGSDYYDLGRTLTHEMGHFFEIWHTWGDDGGSCPWSGSHKDDGIADTPPEADSKFFNFPDTIIGGTYYDACRYHGAIDTQATLYGVATLDYMNYTDDIAMHMFTTDQAAAMAAQVAPTGENYTLTQNPTLLNWPANTSVAERNITNEINIFPNPTTGIVNILTSTQGNPLQQITVSDIMGQQVYAGKINGNADNFYSIDLSAMSKGIYFVRCTFASGSITRKILLQ